MNIDELIKEEAPNDDEHDKAYAKMLRSCYDSYSGLPIETLKDLQKAARDSYTGNHGTTAACMVLYKMIEEHENNPED